MLHLTQLVTCSLLNRLRHHFGIQGTVLRWFKSYMTDGSQKIVLDEPNNKAAVSDHAILKQGVPQGSVLGPNIVHPVYKSSQ